MRKLLIAMAAVGIIASCVTPVIPLPPPPISSLSYNLLDPEAGIIQLAGEPNPTYRGYYIFLLNIRSGEGVISRADAEDGSFLTEPLAVADQDQLELWAARNTEAASSEVACISIDFAQEQIRSCER